MSTSYTDKELRAAAQLAIRDDARAAGVKARCVGFSLHVYQGGVTLVAYGERTDLPYRQAFNVNVAI